MKYHTREIPIRKFKYAGSNQHGARFKRNGNEIVTVMRLIPITVSDFILMATLSESLGVIFRSVDSDEDGHYHYIDIIAKEAIKKI